MLDHTNFTVPNPGFQLILKKMNLRSHQFMLSSIKLVSLYASDLLIFPVSSHFQEIFYKITASTHVQKNSLKKYA